ncbi:MAG: hypothetical protein ACRDD7_02550 [Peptostreptococcaceae bacterium]
MTDRYMKPIPHKYCNCNSSCKCPKCNECNDGPSWIVLIFIIILLLDDDNKCDKDLLLKLLLNE